MLTNLHTRILIAVWGLVLLSSLLIPQELLRMYWGDARVVQPSTLVWICMCMAVFWAGTFIERSLAESSESFPDKEPDTRMQFERLAASLRTAKMILACVVAVICLRFTWCVYLQGSLVGTFELMFTDPVNFKFERWQATNIHGLGMVADLSVACTIFAFAAFAWLRKHHDSDFKQGYGGFDASVIYRTRLTTRRLLLVSMIVLTVYMLLSNERVPFVGGLLGGVIAYLLIQRRIPWRGILYMMILLMVLWVFVEAGRRRYFGSQSMAFILEHGKNQLLLYLVAGLRNVDTIVNFTSDHSYGWYTLNFLLSPFKLDELLPLTEQFFGYTPYHLKKGLGVVPVFGTAFADYHLAGICYFLVVGFLYQRLNRHAILRKDFLSIQVYSYFLVALCTSFVAFLPSVFRFWINVVTLVMINKGRVWPSSTQIGSVDNAYCN